MIGLIIFVELVIERSNPIAIGIGVHADFLHAVSRKAGFTFGVGTGAMLIEASDAVEELPAAWASAA
jgi:hypothetical protein